MGLLHSRLPGGTHRKPSSAQGCSSAPPDAQDAVQQCSSGLSLLDLPQDVLGVIMAKLSTPHDRRAFAEASRTLWNMPAIQQHATTLIVNFRQHDHGGSWWRGSQAYSAERALLDFPRDATLRKLMLVVHDDKDATVLKGWLSLTRSPLARSRLADVKVLVICDPFFWGQRKRIDLDADCFYWSLQRERDALALSHGLLAVLPNLSHLELTSGKFNRSFLQPFESASTDLKLCWNKTSGSSSLQPADGLHPPIALTWWCSRISSTKVPWGLKLMQ